MFRNIFSSDALMELFDKYFEKKQLTEDQIDRCIDNFDEMSVEEGQEFIGYMLYYVDKPLYDEVCKMVKNSMYN